MRPHYVLLVAVAMLLVACDAASHRSASQKKLTMKTSDLGRSADVALNSKSNRFLRSQKTFDAVVPDADVGDEERGGQGLINKFLGRNDLTMDKLSRMMKDQAFKLKMFKNWDKHQQSIGKIREKMFLKLNPRYKKLLMEYLNEYKRTGPKLKKLKPRKRPTGNRVIFAEV